MPPIDRLLKGAYTHLEENGLPLVTLSYAQSLDGSLALRRGQPTAISGRESLSMTHQLRAAHDAILVGVGTILADDPQLDVRLAEGDDPQVLILDGNLNTPPTASVLGDQKSPMIFCSKDADQEKEVLLSSEGAQVLRVPALDGGLDLQAVLDELGRRGVASLMVEGGARVIASFLKAGLVDQVVLTIAPTFIGGLKAVEQLLAEDAEQLPRLQEMQVEMLGEDLVMWGTLERGQ